MVRQIEGLQTIPGVGPSLAKDLRSLGIREVSDLRGCNAETMYADLCDRAAQRIDKCVLYVLRRAVYFASESRHDAELLKWWNWKDAAISPEMRAAVAGASRIPLR